MITKDKIYWLWSLGHAVYTTKTGGVKGYPRDFADIVITDLDGNLNETLYHTVYGSIAEERQENLWLFDPKNHDLLFLQEYYMKRKNVVSKISKTNISEDIKILVNKYPDDSLVIKEVSNDLKTWLVTYTSQKPYFYYLYDRETKKLTELLDSASHLRNYTLCRKVPFKFISRDKHVITAYLSLPPDVDHLRADEVTEDNQKRFSRKGLLPKNPLPLILRVHGGPDSRDHEGYDVGVNFYTSRGYAVLQVNFRMSIGFGLKFFQLGHREWAGTMSNDLEDAVGLLVESKIADKDRMLIYGASYGGYATLVALTKTPDLFNCGFIVCSPADLYGLFLYFNKTQRTFLGVYQEMIGYDLEKGEGHDFLKERSPINWLENLTKPFMIVQGRTDVRVPIKLTDVLAETLKNLSKPFKYVVYPDEGHGIYAKQPNVYSYYATTEEFVHNCLGGGYQPYKIGQYNSSIKIMHDTLNFESKTRMDEAEKETSYTYSMDELQEIFAYDEQRRAMHETIAKAKKKKPIKLARNDDPEQMFNEFLENL